MSKTEKIKIIMSVWSIIKLGFITAMAFINPLLVIPAYILVEYATSRISISVLNSLRINKSNSATPITLDENPLPLEGDEQDTPNTETPRKSPAKRAKKVSTKKPTAQKRPVKRS